MVEGVGLKADPQRIARGLWVGLQPDRALRMRGKASA